MNTIDSVPFDIKNFGRRRDSSCLIYYVCQLPIISSGSVTETDYPTSLKCHCVQNAELKRKSSLKNECLGLSLWIDFYNAEIGGANL